VSVVCVRVRALVATEAAGAADGPRQRRGLAPHGALVSTHAAVVGSGQQQLGQQQEGSVKQLLHSGCRRRVARAHASDQLLLLLCAPPRRLLANLYNGNVYLWNYNDSVRAVQCSCAGPSSRVAVQVQASAASRALAADIGCVFCDCRRWSSRLRSQSCQVWWRVLSCVCVCVCVW
jgi:hypothetical protein